MYPNNLGNGAETFADGMLKVFRSKGITYTGPRHFFFGGNFDRLVSAGGHYFPLEINGACRPTKVPTRK